MFLQVCRNLALALIVEGNTMKIIIIICSKFNVCVYSHVLFVKNTTEYYNLNVDALNDLFVTLDIWLFC